MTQQRTGRRKLHWSLPLSLSAAAAAQGLILEQSLLAGECCCQYEPRCFSMLSRATTQELLSQQAGRGMVLQQTIWSIQFERGTAKLHYSGRAVLHRLVRQFPDMPLELFVQSAQDIEFDSEAPAEYAKERDTLDFQRAQAVRDYMTIVLRQPEPKLYIHDPQRVGMWAYEADDIYGKLKLSGFGVLPEAAVTGTDTSGFVEIKTAN